PGAETDAGPATPADRAPCGRCGGVIADDGYCEQCGAPAVRERDHWIERPAPWIAGVCDRGIRHARNEDAMALAAGGDPGRFAPLVVGEGVSTALDSDVASLAAARAAREVLMAEGPVEGETEARLEAWTGRLAAATEAANQAVTTATA